MKTSHGIMLAVLVLTSVFVSFSLGYGEGKNDGERGCQRQLTAKEYHVREEVAQMYLTLVDNPQSLQDQLIYECVVYGECSKASYLLNNSK